MAPIHNLKDEKKSGNRGYSNEPAILTKSIERKSATAITTSHVAVKTTTITTTNMASKTSIKQQHMVASSKERSQLSSFVSDGPNQMNNIAELQKVLDQNNDKR